MLSREDNELLCRVGPGTPMGALLRQYWIPTLLSSELPEPDGAPVRVRILGEDLIGFRATSGRVGLIQNHCPHRGTSLFFGRNEAEGLRCVYHGWKFDCEGFCVDMPSEPPESTFKSKVRATAYPCVERNDVVWAYLGPRPTPPPLPDLEPNMLARGQYAIQKVFRECNWFQGLEGDIDTSHLGFLHLGAVQPESTTPGTFDYYNVADRAPKYDVVDTEFGTSYGAYRPAEADTYYWRIAHFLFPFFTMIPTGILGVQVLVRAWVPIDDEHVMFWSIGVPRSREGRAGTGGASTLALGGRPVAAAGARVGDVEFLPDTTDWTGRFRLTQNKDNDYLIDRAAQRTQSFTGIAGIHQQDQAVTESMGPIVDRTQEHLASSDAMVIRTRRRVITAARALRDGGVVPPGVDRPEVYRHRSGGVVLPRGAGWLDATKDLRRAFA
ncbi:MAG: Rieske 2Fe-2S domain-containing protein [Candidatus Rokuibacteriota bacterium]|nr:MAG: Rieske 2Fe-2S domain-containing protein [Candidatus Rokubacteria bacterium]